MGPHIQHQVFTTNRVIPKLLTSITTALGLVTMLDAMMPVSISTTLGNTAISRAVLAADTCGI